MPEEIDPAALAKELGIPDVEPPTPAPPSETPPKGDETPKPPDPTEGVQPPKDETKDGEKPADGETPPDSLGELAKDPKFLQRILAHPELGPKVNKWADDAANKQVEADRRTPRGPSEADVRQKIQIEKEDKFFGEISEEDLAEELKDKDAAAAYGRYQLRLEAKTKEPTPEETNYNIKFEAAKSLVVTYRSMVDDSELSDEVKAALQPEKFTHLGEGAMVAWGKAVYEAHVAHGVAQQVESAIEEERAKLDPERKGAGGGRPPGTMPDLMGTDSSVGLTQALAEEERKRKK